MDKSEFQSKCRLIIKKMRNECATFDELIDSAKNGNPAPNCQYNKVVYWYRVLFKKSFKHDHKKIIGFNIMPYQITRQDIIRAQVKSRAFNKKNKRYVDYDPVSGNFHKHIYNGIQIALLDEKSDKVYGVGLPSNKTKFDLKTKNYYANSLKKDKMYYPNIDDKNKNNLDNLEDSIYKVLEDLKVVK